MSTPAWMDQALCKGIDGAAELFFPTQGESTLDAVEVCERCPVREDCLAYALAAPEKFGVWGGLSERQRQRMRHRAAAVCGSRSKYQAGCRCSACCDANNRYVARRRAS